MTINNQRKLKNKKINREFIKQQQSLGFRVLSHLKSINFKIFNSIANIKIKLKKFLFKFGYVSFIGVIILLIISDSIIYYFFKINYLINFYKFIFLSKQSPEWVSGLGTFMVAMLAVRKLFEKSRPGLRVHIDKNNVSIEIIGNSKVSGFALLKHIYIVNEDLSKQFPLDFKTLYRDLEYSEPFSNSKRAVIFLKKGKNDNKLKSIIDMAQSFENSRDKHVNDLHYIDVYFSINDHILPISLRHLINVDDLKNENWSNR